jgi:hypothetical protein
MAIWPSRPTRRRPRCHDDYDKSLLPTGLPFGTPQETLDCACGLYLNDPTAWLIQQPPTN